MLQVVNKWKQSLITGYIGNGTHLRPGVSTCDLLQIVTIDDVMWRLLVDVSCFHVEGVIEA